MNQVIDSMYSKRIEVHYNEYYINVEKEKIKLELKGKIKCPLLNISISSLVCSKLMDRPTWPRNIDPEVCKKCGCRINLSIAKFSGKK